MHRFAKDAENRGRHDPSRLRRVLENLRKAGVSFVSLEEAAAYASDASRSPSKLAISFTVDDGYSDFAEFGWPVFREFDCPVSLFVVPGVIEGNAWFWWDRLDWLMQHAPTPHLSLCVGIHGFQASWDNEHRRFAVYEHATQWLKQWRPDELDRALHHFGEQVGTALPNSPPPQYRVLNWLELRELESQGVQIGAHSMTHPVLSLCDDERSKWEIVESVRLVRDRLRQPLPVFCYPNGKAEDHGPREWGYLREAGIPFAITTAGGVLKPASAGPKSDDWSYNLPRVGYHKQAGEFIREFFT